MALTDFERRQLIDRAKDLTHIGFDSDADIDGKAVIYQQRDGQSFSGHTVPKVWKPVAIFESPVAAFQFWMTYRATGIAVLVYKDTSGWEIDYRG